MRDDCFKRHLRCRLTQHRNTATVDRWSTDTVLQLDRAFGAWSEGKDFLPILFFAFGVAGEADAEFFEDFAVDFAKHHG